MKAFPLSWPHSAGLGYRHNQLMLDCFAQSKEFSVGIRASSTHESTMLITWIFVSTTFRPVSTRTVQGPAQSTIAFSHGSLLFALCCKVLVLEARSVLGLAYNLVTLTFVTSLYEFFDLAAHSSPAKYCGN
jgi:hypothetical protein